MQTINDTPLPIPDWVYPVPYICLAVLIIGCLIMCIRESRRYRQEEKDDNGHH